VLVFEDGVARSNADVEDYRSETFPETRRILVAPIGVQDDIIGVLDIRGTSDKPFPQHALRMAELLGRQLGLYLSLWKSEKQQRQAFEDLWHQLKSPARHTFKRADDLVRDMNTKWNLSDNSSAENIEKALLKLRGVSRKAKRVAVNAGIFKELAGEGRIKIPPEKLIPLKGEEVHQMIIAAGVDTRLMLEEEEEVKFYSPKKGFTELDRHEVKVNFDLLEQAVNCPQHLLWRLTSQRIMRTRIVVDVLPLLQLHIQINTPCRSTTGRTSPCRCGSPSRGTGTSRPCS